LLRRGLLVDGRGGDQSGQLERLDEPDLADLAGGRLGDEEVAALECAPLGLAPLSLLVGVRRGVEGR